MLEELNWLVQLVWLANWTGLFPTGSKTHPVDNIIRHPVKNPQWSPEFISLCQAAKVKATHLYSLVPQFEL